VTEEFIIHGPQFSVEGSFSSHGTSLLIPRRAIFELPILTTLHDPYGLAHLTAHLNLVITFTYAKPDAVADSVLPCRRHSLLETVVRSQLCGRPESKPPALVLTLADYSH
jgi:hypothetical protein